MKLKKKMYIYIEDSVLTMKSVISISESKKILKKINKYFFSLLKNYENFKPLLYFLESIFCKALNLKKKQF